MDDPSPSSPGALQRALACLIGLSLVLASSTAYLLINRTPSNPAALLEAAKGSSLVQAEAIAALVAGADGVWDSHPDPEVARIMQPDVVEREFRGVMVSSNGFGMREEPFLARKPKGITRIVLLGDSFVFGYKAKAEDRLGVFLKRFLEEQGVEGEIECLHLAASSWNILSESAYLRRQLADLQPDLVVHVIISNDLDDTRGPRGFGAIGNYSPQQRKRAGGMVSNLTPKGLWPRRIQGYLLYHLDHQSRARYASAAAEIKRLADAVEARGGKYLLLSAWESYAPMVATHLTQELAAEQVAYVSQAFTADPRYRVDKGDRHWNRAGHEKIAQLIYGLCQARSLLPNLRPPAWAPAQAAVEQIHGGGLQQVAHTKEYEALLLDKAHAQIASSINFQKLTRLGAKQVHAGVMERGLVAPFAALILANTGATQLHIKGLRLLGAALEGAHATVSIEGLELGKFALDSGRHGEAIEVSFGLPASLAQSPFVTVSIESDDYAYADLASGRCASFQLTQIELK